jgi:hypothetical protein
MRRAQVRKAFFEGVPGIGEKRTTVLKEIFAERGFRRFPEKEILDAGIPAGICGRLRERFDEMNRERSAEVQEKAKGESKGE